MSRHELFLSLQLHWDISYRLGLGRCEGVGVLQSLSSIAYKQVYITPFFGGKRAVYFCSPSFNLFSPQGDGVAGPGLLAGIWHHAPALP
jgi:hypothetical protein